MSYFAFVVLCFVSESVLLVLSQPGETVCGGGALCYEDSDCQANQRCIVTPCGQRRCSITVTRDPCRGFCLNGGICTAPADAPSCTCPEGFSGRRCENFIRPGICPIIRKGDFGVCGGVPCNDDQGCGPGQKCCASACGGQLCTSVGIIIDPCRNYCLNGGTCSAPADAPSCTCRKGFSGTRCENSIRPGTCPIIKSGKEYVSPQKGRTSVCGGVRCTNDQQCGPNQKCCTLACGGRFCTNVEITVTTTEEPQTLTCANVLCAEGNVCRYVSTCSSCPLQPSCIPVDQVYDGIDNECRRQNYTEVILEENPSKESAYSQLTCGPRYHPCPPGSDCAGGLCCRGKVTVPLRKPGLCPTSQASVCKAAAECTNDYECPGEQKCCPECPHVCRDPIFVRNQVECGNTRCAPGLVCVFRTPYCAPGKLCILALLPVCEHPQCVNCTSNEVCVPTLNGYACSIRNECGVCPRGEVCKPTNIVCVTQPCPQYACVPADECGVCPLGQVCKPTNIVCVTQPCPQYACVPVDKCGGCPRGQVCKPNSCTTKPCASYQCYPALY